MAPNEKQSVSKLYAAAPLPQQKTMRAMRKVILEILPEADEVISYGMPAFKLNGQIVAGLSTNKNHVGYYPFSGSILGLFKKELAGYSHTISAIHVPIDKPLPKSLIKKLLRARISQCSIANGTVSKSKYQAKENYWKSIGLAAPARRGLIDNKLFELRDLTKLTESQLKTIHAIGPNALKTIKLELTKKSLSLKKMP